MTLMTKTTLTTFLTIPMTPQLLPYTQHGDGADTMDMTEENKRFVMSAIGAGIVFLIAYLIVSSYFEGDIQKKRSDIARSKRELADAIISGGRGPIGELTAEDVELLLTS